METGVRSARERPCPRRSPFFVRRSGFPSLLLRRPVIDRLVRPLVPPLSLTVARFVEQRRVRLEVTGGEGAACMFRGGGFREVEACSDPPSPALVSGKGVSFRFAFAGFWLRRAEACKAPRCHLGIRCCLGKGY